MEYELTTAQALFIGFVGLLSLGLTIGGYAVRRGSLAFAGVAAWAVLAIICFNLKGYVWGTFDEVLGIGWLSIGMVITTAVEAAFIMSRGEEKALDELDEKRTHVDTALDEMEAENERLKARRR